MVGPCLLCSRSRLGGSSSNRHPPNGIVQGEIGVAAGGKLVSLLFSADRGEIGVASLFRGSWRLIFGKLVSLLFSADRGEIGVASLFRGSWRLIFAGKPRAPAGRCWLTNLDRVLRDVSSRSLNGFAPATQGDGVRPAGLQACLQGGKLVSLLFSGGKLVSLLFSGGKLVSLLFFRGSWRLIFAGKLRAPAGRCWLTNLDRVLRDVSSRSLNGFAPATQGDGVRPASLQACLRGRPRGRGFISMCN